MKKNIFFLIIILIFLIQLDTTLAQMTCPGIEQADNKIYANCYEIKTEQYNSTRPTINVTFQEDVVITEYDLIRIGNLDYDIDALEPEEYFDLGNDHAKYDLDKIDEERFKPSQILSDGTYMFDITAFNIPNIHITAMVFFKINASQMNFWIQSPAQHSIEKPDFAASKTTTNNLTIQTERPVEGCKYTYSIANYPIQELYDDILHDAFNLTDPTTLTLKNFNFIEGRATNSIHNFNKLDVICKEQQQGSASPRYSYKQLYYVAQTTDPIITTKPTPEIVQDTSAVSSYLNITTQQTTACTLDVPALPADVDGNNPGFEYDNNYLFDELNQYTKTEEQQIKFAHRPSPYDFLFNVTCTNLAGRSSSTIQKIQTDFDISTEFNFKTPTKFSTKEINVSGEYSSNNANCYATFNDETTTHPLDSKGIVSSSGKYKYQKTISKTNLDEGQNEVQVICDEMPYDFRSTKSFTIDATPPTNMEIDTPDNSCSLTQISATFKAEDENGIDLFEYNAEYTGSEDIELKEEGTTSKSLKLKLPKVAELLIENETISIQARALDRAGNPTSWVTKSIKITKSNILACDFSDPLIRIKENYSELSATWDINVSCVDDTGCAQTFNWGHETNRSKDCEPMQSASLTETIPIREAGTFCAIVYDLNNNNATATKQLEYGEGCAGKCGGECGLCELGSTCDDNVDCISNYCVEGICESASCDDGEKNGLETDTDCGGDCEPCELGSACALHSDCTTKNCIQGLCTEASCDNNRQDGIETDTDCGGNCEPCALGASCNENSDCIEGECINNNCKLIQETQDLDDDETQKEGASLLGLILLIIGLLSLIAGSVLLYLESEKKKKQIQQDEVNKTKIALSAGMPKVSSLQNSEEQTPLQKLSPHDAEMRRKAWLNAVQEKDDKRKEVLGMFKEDETTKQETPITQTEKENEQKTSPSQNTKTQQVTPTTQPKKQTKPESKKETNQDSQEYVELDELHKEKDAFEQLKEKNNQNKTTTKTTTKKSKPKTTNTTKNTPKSTTKKQTKKTTKQEDDEFFKKLKEMNEKNKNKTKKTTNKK